MRCPSCGFENPPGMKLCGQCAAPLTGPRPQCGFANPPGLVFCGQCAMPLTNAPSAPHPFAPPPSVPLAEGYIRVNALGPVPIKGLHAPVGIFRGVDRRGLGARPPRYIIPT